MAIFNREAALKGLNNSKGKAAPSKNPVYQFVSNPLLKANPLQKQVPVPPIFGVPKVEAPLPSTTTARTTPQETTQTAADFARGVGAGAGVLGGLAKEVAQGTMRGYAGIGSALTGQTLTPTGKFQEAIYGTNEPLTAQRAGEELPGVDKGSKYAAPLGVMVASLDLIPGGNYLKTLAKLNKAEDIIKVLDKEASWTRLLPQSEYDDFVKTLQKETDTKKIQDTINTKKDFVKKNKDALTEQIKTSKVPGDGTPPPAAPALRGTPEVTPQTQVLPDAVATTPPKVPTPPVARVDTPPVTNTLPDPRNFKTADDFVAAQGKPVYRGGEKFDVTRMNDEALPVTRDKSIADTFARIKNEFAVSPAGIVLGKKPNQNLVETYYIEPSAKIAKRQDIPDDVYKTYKEANPLTKPQIAEPIINKWAKENGFDGIDYATLGKTSAKEDEIKILNANILKTKSQLTDIWNQAQTATPAPITPTNTVNVDDLSKTRQEAVDKYPELGVDSGFKDLNERTRGTVSHQQAIASAERLGWSEEKMLNMPVGKALSDTELMAARGISNHADNVLQQMKDVLKDIPPNSPAADKLRIDIAFQKVKAFKLKAFVVGASSEAGRALSSLRANVGSINALEQRLAKLMNNPKTPQHIKDFIADKIGSFEGTTEDFLQLLRDVNNPTWQEMVAEFATAIKLTSIPTHIVNTATSTAMIAMAPLERAIASFFDLARVSITGGKRERFLADIQNEITGQVTGWSNAGREVVRGFADENYAWKSRALQDFSLEGPKIKGRPGMNKLRDRFLNVFGKVVRVPFRALGAFDVGLRQPAQQGARIVAIGRLAMKKGFRPGTEAYTNFVADAIKNPTVEVIEEATKTSDRRLFQQELPPMLARMQNGLSDYPLSKLIVPFFKTVVNLSKTAIEYSPAAPILPSVRSALKTPGAQADALARMTIGTTAMIPLTFVALEGNITLEAPKNQAERDAFFASGKQPYSIKIGENWVPYSRLSPFSEWFVTAGLMAKSIENEDEESLVGLAKDTFFAHAGNLLDKSFASGLADLLDALRGSEAQQDKWLNNFVVGSTLPSLSGNITRSKDPVIREVNSLADAYKSRIPFLSETLKPQRDAFGKPLTRQGSAIQRLISPIIPSAVTNDIVRKEHESLGITMGFPEKSVSGFKMTDEQYYDYQRIAGQATYAASAKLIMNPAYQNMSAQDREKALTSVMKTVREQVRIKVAAEQVVMKEIQDKLEKGGMSSAEAKEKAVAVYEVLKEKQTNQGSQ